MGGSTPSPPSSSFILGFPSCSSSSSLVVELVAVVPAPFMLSSCSVELVAVVVPVSTLWVEVPPFFRRVRVVDHLTLPLLHHGLL